MGQSEYFHFESVHDVRKSNNHSNIPIPNVTTVRSAVGEYNLLIKLGVALFCSTSLLAGWVAAICRGLALTRPLLQPSKWAKGPR